MRSATTEQILARAGTRPAAIVSLAMAVPDNVVTNATVAEGAGVTERWIAPHRRPRAPHVPRASAPRLAAAGREALDEAGLAPEDVDLVLVATVGADELLPNAAPLVAHDSAPTAPARWTSAPPAPASCRRWRWPPPRSSAAAASTCS